MRSFGLVILGVWALCGCGDDPRPGPVGDRDAGGGGTDASVAADVGTTSERPVGAPCASDAECTDPSDAECFTESFGSVSWPGGFCSKACDPDGGDGQCGTSGICVSAGSSGGGSSISGMFCTTSCTSDAECRSAEGYRCQMLFGFGYCAPPGL